MNNLTEWGNGRTLSGTVREACRPLTTRYPGDWQWRWHWLSESAVWYLCSPPEPIPMESPGCIALMSPQRSVPAAKEAMTNDMRLRQQCRGAATMGVGEAITTQYNEGKRRGCTTLSPKGGMGPSVEGRLISKSLMGRGVSQLGPEQEACCRDG